MAFKTSMDRSTISNKNNESDTEENKAESSRETDENTNKLKFCKKKSSKQILSPKFSSAPVIPVTGQSHRRVPGSLPLFPVLPTTVIPVTTIAPFYSQYVGQSLHYPVNSWSRPPTVRLQNPMYNIPYPPVPVVLTPQVLAPICPYASMLTPPILAPAPQPVIIEEIPISNYAYESVSTFSPEQTVPASADSRMNEMKNVDSEATLYETVEYSRSIDPLEMYLTLPRELFPTARMLAMDPNPIVDEFCRIDNIHNHAPWIMDLEFGVPKSLVTRPIAIYDVKFNSVHCRNTRNAIHPGFESCSREFKNALVFYYDCIISSWYRGFVHMSCDESVENFQSWMHNPMQVFGMCWP